jgi:hypothetical protein
MSYQSLNTGLQIDKTKDFAYDPTLFKLKSNSDVAMPQTIAAEDIDTYVDVVFANIDFVVEGDLSYDGSVVTYNGIVPMDMTMNLSCSVDSSNPGTIIHIAQAQDAVIDPGSESSAKCETITAIQSLNVATTFTMQPDDTLNLMVKADKAATLGIYHIQVVLKQIKVAV